MTVDPYPELPHRVRNYVLNSVIGKGGFAIVYKAVNVFYNVEFAVKVVCPPKNESSSILRSFEAEVNSLIKIDHPNIIRLYDYFTEDEHMFLVLEFCNGGTLEDKITNGDVLSDFVKFKICSQIISALKYCYDKSIAHRDIKTSNVLFDASGRVKVADFGLSELIDHDESFNEFNGSLLYASPEICRMISFNPFKSDIWSLGVLFYRLFSNSYPFNGRTKIDLKNRICEGIYTEKCRPPISRIIKKMLVVDPENRITYEQLEKLDIFFIPSMKISKLGKCNCQSSSSSRMLQAQPNVIHASCPRRRCLLTTSSTPNFKSSSLQRHKCPRCLNVLSRPTFSMSPTLHGKEDILKKRPSI